MGSKSEFSDEGLLKNELEKGNHDALFFLMDTYHKPLCTYIYSLSKDYELSKDVVQEVFIKLWEDRNNIQSVRFINRFLYKASYNGLLNQLRREKRMVSIDEEHLLAIDEIVENEDDAYFQRQIRLINFEVEKLPQRCKETFLLSKQEGLTNEEIANFMNVSTRTVEAQMNKAFNILREKLKDKIGPILLLFLGFKSKIRKTIKPAIFSIN